MLQQEVSALCGFEEAVQALCEIYCAGSLHEQALGNWFSSVDFEALPPEVTCMASAAGSLSRFSGVPEGQIPRLRGIIKYVHTLNSGMMAGVCMLGTALNRAGIDVLLLEDTALYMAHPDAPQRHLWQMRIGVRRRDFDRAVEIIRETGFEVEKYVSAAAARQGVTRQVSVMSYDDSAYLWENASELKKGSAVFLCPELAATFLCVSQSAFRVLTKPKPRTAMVRWSMDMGLLASRMTEKDWHRAAQLAEKEQAASQIRLLLEIFGQLSGDQRIAERFGSNWASLPGMLMALRELPDGKKRARRLWLRCRLRYPDSLWQTGRIFTGEVLRKIRGTVNQEN